MQIKSRAKTARTSFSTSLAVAAATLLTTSLTGISARAADQAICVGVNQYTGLRPGSSLSGCVNDARLFAEKLRLYGFANPVVLADANATKSNIHAQLTALKRKLGPNDRFVFFFAGHGTLSSSGESVILPSDAQDSSESNDIQVKELYDDVKGVGAGVETIVLDSCHSGGMVRGLGGLRKFNNRRPRFYVRTKLLKSDANTKRDIKRWQEDDVNGSDDLHKDLPDNGGNGGAGRGLCYFTAALKDEVANETEINGEPHGVFTYYLAEAMTGKGNLWQDLSAAVSSKVGDATDFEQKPLLYPNRFLTQVAFGGKGGNGGGGGGDNPNPNPNPNPQPTTLDKIWNLSKPDPNVVSLERFPNKTPVPVGTATYFTITVGQDGYLLLLNRDPSGQLYVVFPKSDSLTALQVHAGQQIRVPGDAGKIVRPDTPGTDGLKAILFTRQENAQAMLKPFVNPQSGGFRSIPARSASRAWKEDNADDAGMDFFTSEMTTLIVPASGSGSEAPN